jgi:type IV fimbrial biogenesis protein FimT
MANRGFTLIELLVALAIAGFLLVMAAPLYTQWLADNQIKNGAQLVADGLRFAQSEAVKRNLQMEFVLDSTVKSGGWQVRPVAQAALQKGYFSEGADRVTFAVTPAGLSTVTFTGVGTILPANADGSAPFTAVDISSTVSGSRPLRVVVGGTRSGIKICDPAWTAIDPGDPKACPPLGG